MTTPIKPPASTPLPAPAENEQTSDGSAVGQASDAPVDKIDKLQQVPGELAVEAAADPVQVLALELKAGTIDVQTAVERLLERAVQGVGPGALSGEMREELENLLRAALRDDPNLVALGADLERGSKAR